MNCGKPAALKHEPLHKDPLHTVVSSPLQPGALLSEKEEEVCISIFRSVMRARHRLLAHGSSVAKEFGLHIAELNVIDMLGKLGPITMGALSRTTFISPSNTTHTVKKLELTGLVARQRSSTSERMVMVSLTDTGQQIFKACYPRILMTVEADLEQRLNTAERATLAKLLEKLAP